MSVPTIPEPRRIPVSRTTRWTRHARNLRVSFFSLLPQFLFQDPHFHVAASPRVYAGPLVTRTLPSGGEQRRSRSNNCSDGRWCRMTSGNSRHRTTGYPTDAMGAYPARRPL
jgi:hypothetical protein